MEISGLSPSYLDELLNSTLQGYIDFLPLKPSLQSTIVIFTALGLHLSALVKQYSAR